MSKVLLDANVLIAMSWPAHVSHAAALRWFARNASRGWVTCPVTEAAFVRILSNPAFSPNALVPRQALALLQANVAHSHHHFWPDDLPLVEALGGSVKGVAGHKQITDAYLLALAAHHRGALASFDKGVGELARMVGSSFELVASP